MNNEEDSPRELAISAADTTTSPYGNVVARTCKRFPNIITVGYVTKSPMPMLTTRS